MNKISRTQTADQAFKGGLLGLFVYFANKWNMDPVLVSILLPMIGAALACLSQKFGNTEIASFFDPKADDE